MLGLLLCLPAWVLAGPGAAWVAHWRFLHRVPRAAIVLWQAGALSALLWIAVAGLVVAQRLWTRPSWAHGIEAVPYGLVVAFVVLVLVRLVWSLIKVGAASGARRRRHRELVELLGRPGNDGSPGLWVLAEAMPMAYCLPGLRESRVVLSEGTLAALDPAEVEAVLEHERAHVRARHDLVLDTFVALHRAFPLFIRSELPRDECRLLVEMLADDAARRRVGALPLARALVAMAESPVPQAGLGVGYRTTVRVDRLARTDAPRGLAPFVYVLSLGLVTAPLLAALITLDLIAPFR